MYASQILGDTEVKLMINDTNRESLLKAINQFDQRERHLQEWQGWESKQNHKYAIDHNNHLYPVKHIISRATGTPVSSFSGGDEANTFVKKKGFAIVELHPDLPSNILGLFQKIMDSYVQAKKGGQFSKEHPMWGQFTELVKLLANTKALKDHPSIKLRWSVGQGNWANIPWISFLHSKETDTTQTGVYVVVLFREDMSGFYLSFNQGVTEPRKRLGAKDMQSYLSNTGKKVISTLSDMPLNEFLASQPIDLRTKASLGLDYQAGDFMHKIYESNQLPTDGQFLKDLSTILNAYETYVARKNGGESVVEVQDMEDQPETLANDLGPVIGNIKASGFIFEPWQIAAYVTALRTKPFVILAGVTGTGKSKLPKLVAQMTGGESTLIPVRPDWTDSSDILGYTDLQGNFRPGRLLEVVRTATENPQTHYVCIIDEMNLARVEHYFAEILSRIEDRQPSKSGGFASNPLLNQNTNEMDAQWMKLGLPPNLAMVGTVNMDESAHGFSRKVLDRAFTIELSDIDLTKWQNENLGKTNPSKWSVQSWYPRAIQLGGLDKLGDAEKSLVNQVITTLTEINTFLTQAQLQVGYRTRDEVALYVLHAQAHRSYFVDQDGQTVDSLDLALMMKILPRIVGGSSAIRRIVLQLLGWANNGQALTSEEDAEQIMKVWETSGRAGAIKDAKYPRTAARLCLMWERLLNEGFTSFWL